MPPLHILRAHNSQEYRFYELTGDLPESLHFQHFEQTNQPKPARGRVHLKGETEAKDEQKSPAQGRVRLSTEAKK